MNEYMDYSPIATLLPEQTGLPSALEIASSRDGRLTLHFGDEVTTNAPDFRAASDLQAVLRDAAHLRVDDPLYTVYRDIRPRRLDAEIERRGLTYVIAALRAGVIDGTREWVRTRGHTNSAAPGTSFRYPEVHEVLTGEGIVYLQDADTSSVDNVVFVPMKAGDKIVVAPGWASLMANTGTEPLIVGTFRMADCVAEGSALMKIGGLAYYLLKDELGEPMFDANPQYRNPPEPRRTPPIDTAAWGLSPGTPLLSVFHENPDFLRFLLRPQDFAAEWKTLYDLKPGC